MRYINRLFTYLVLLQINLLLLRLRDRWAEVDEICLFCGLGDETSRKWNVEFRPLRRAGEMTYRDRGAFIL